MVTDSNYGIDKKLITYEQFQNLVMDTLEDHYAFKFGDLGDSYEFTSMETGLSGFLDYKGNWSVCSRYNSRIGNGDTLEAAITDMNKTEEN